MKSIHLFLAALALLVLSVSCVTKSGKTAETPADYQPAFSVYNGGADTLLYRYLEPAAVKKGKTYPLVLFLHGAGERGNDNLRQLIHCSRLFTNPVNRGTYPCYVLAPQCPADGYWAYESRPGFTTGDMPEDFPETALMQAVMQLVDDFAASHPVDTRRLYIMGLSMGGMATWDALVRHPDKFAAAVPICGAVNIDRLSGDIKSAVRICHGDADNVVPLEYSRQAFRKLRSCGVNVQYREYPGVGHDSWNRAISEPDFLPWLFSQK